MAEQMQPSQQDDSQSILRQIDADIELTGGKTSAWPRKATADIFFAGLVDSSPDQLASKTPVYENKALLSCLFAPTCLMESTRVSKSDDGAVNSHTVNNFYICSGRAVTIGYGSKIEIKDGKICNEGLEVLDMLKLYRKDGTLITSLDEKAAIALKYYNLRNKNITVRTKDNKKVVAPAHKILIDTQIRAYQDMGLPFASVPDDNAFEVALNEYSKKMAKISNADEQFNSSYFVLALASDLAYQYGDAGVRGTDMYKDITQKHALTKNVKSWDTSTEMRPKLRAWLLETAHLFEKDAKARAGKPATAQEQAKLLFKGLQSFEKKFHDQLMSRSEHSALLMQKMTSLMMAQNFYNIYQRDPNATEIANIEKASKDLVFNEIMQAPEIEKHIANNYQTFRRLDAIQNIKIDTLENESPLLSVRQAMIDEVALSTRQQNKEKDKPTQTAQKPSVKRNKKQPKRHIADKGTPQRKSKPLTALLQESAQRVPDTASERWQNEPTEATYHFNKKFDYTA